MPSCSQYDSSLIILWTKKVYCSRLTILWTYKCNVRQSALLKFLKISIKNSKCAASNKHIQDGPTGRYENRRGSEKKTEESQIQPERQTMLSLTPEETQKRLKRTKPRVVSYPQRMSWKAQRRSRTRRWFARRFWKLHEDQHILSFSVHL